jgi:serine/threonine-protein kinase
LHPELARLQAALPQRYTLIEAIDQGGMSRVYRAREQLPDRDVVIKVFDEGLSARLGGESFVSEVERTSRLVHPHIVPIYSAGQANEALYYVMPYIEGESLRDRLDRDGRIPIPEAVKLAGQIADALQHAHDKGILHRDIKPTNVLLQGGHALVTDFGVAHALRAADFERERGAPGDAPSGLAFGTPEYMSPEQVEGRAPADARTDTYALGCLLYEMIAGHPPFQAGSAKATAIRQVRDPVPPLSVPGVDVPPGVQRLVAGALAKDPADRPDRVADFAAALSAATAEDRSGTPSGPPSGRWARAIGPGVRTTAALLLVAALAVTALLWRSTDPTSLVAGGRWRASVAVMPFENRTSDSEFDNLGRSLADEIINNLTAVPEVRVIDTYTAASLLKDSLGTPRLLDTLNVQHVIHGYIERYGDALVVNVSESDRGGFLSRRDQHRLDPATLDADQVSIAQAVALSFLDRVGLRADLSAGPGSLGPGRDAYLTGNGLLGQRTPEAMREAIGHFRESIALEPTYAPAHSALSSAYALSVYYKYNVGLPSYELAARSLAAADSAIALDPTLANGYSARGYIRALLGIEIDGAEADFARAEELAPNAPNGPSWSARILAEKGLIDQAFSEARRARDLDPLQAGRRTALASLGFQLGDYDVVIEEARQAYRLEEELLLAKAFEGRALALTGRGVECLRIDFGVYDLVRALCLHSLGREEEARSMAIEAGGTLTSSGIADDRYLDELVAQDLASYYGLVGDAANATRWLRYAFDLSPAGVDDRVLFSALFAPVRDDPGFAAAVAESKADARIRVSQTRARLDAITP